MSKTKITHIITGLNTGGAEIMLLKLLSATNSDEFTSEVISLTDIGSIGKKIAALGISVRALGMKRGIPSLSAFLKLVSWLKQSKPDVTQTWLYHADLLGGLAARLAGCHFVVWNIRSTIIPQGRFSITFWLIRCNAILSHLIPKRIICCAKSAEQVHIKLGYAQQKMTVINNGYDFSSFDRYLHLRAQARAELGFSDSEIVIGAVGRFDPLKDFHNFVVAASKLAAKRNNVRFLMIGSNLDWSNNTLCNWIEAVGLVKKFQLIGEQTDIPHFFSAMDIFCLSSYGEGFPNVVVEAMAMEVPCVVTQAGDAADIVGNDDFVVPIKNADALAEVLLRMCELDPEIRINLGKNGAKRVREKYEIKSISQRYENIWRSYE